MELDAYIRVSRVGGRSGESFISTVAQRERIAKFADAKGFAVAEWHEELDQPGSRADRPKLQEALTRVDTGATGGIIVAKLDRFARSVADAAVAIRRIHEAGGQLVSVEDGFDSTTPMGRFAVNMILALAELELERIREGWSTAQEHAVRRGVHVASRAPTGYRRGSDGRLQLDPVAARAIAAAFEARAGGASLKEVASVLTKRGVVGPYGNKHWTSTAVQKLLRNPAYLGEARSGRHRNPDAHPAIVTQAEWDAAQAARGLSPARSGDGALLSGLLRCAGCRYVMKADTMNGRDGEKLRTYRCKDDHAAGRCPAPASVLGRVIEPHVVGQFFDALGPKGMLAQAVEGGDDVDRLRRELEEAERELEAWVSEEGLVALGRDLFITGLSARQKRVAASRRQLDGKLRPAGAQLPDSAELRGLWPQLSTAERRRILGAGIDAVMLRRGRKIPVAARSLVLFGGHAPDDLPRRGRRVPLASFPWPDDDPVAAGEAVA